MKVKRYGSVVCSLALLALVFASTGQAQVTTATLFGRVLDPSGAVVPGANIAASNEATGAEKGTVTSAGGEFTIPFLSVGSYSVAVQADGFKTYTETGLQLTSGQRANLTYVLELGATTETITITSEAPQMNTVNAEQDISLNNDQVKELPAINRDITGILTLGTGASITDGGWTLSINGLAPRGFTMTVDGVDAVPDAEFAGLSLYQNFNFIKGISFEAIQEVETSKNIFSAETSSTIAGNVNMISKSGTNDLHGSLLYMYQSGGLHAVNHLVARKSPLVYHQYAGSIGGPIKKNSQFIFGVFEGYRFNALVPQSGDVPSRSIREIGLASIQGSAPYWDLWPLPTGAESTLPDGNPAPTAFFAGVGTEKRKDNHGVVKYDWNVNDNNFFNARYVRGRPLRTIPRLIAGNPRTWDGYQENFAASWTSVINPTMTSEIRWGTNVNQINRLDGAFADGKVPFIRGFGNADEPGAEIFSKDGHSTTIEQSFAKTKGKHSIKFGGMYRYMSGTRINEEVPVYTYATQDDLRAANITQARFIFKLEKFLWKRWFVGGFLQDDIRVTPRLMVNLGMRWDYGSVPRSDQTDGISDNVFNRDGPFGQSGASLTNQDALFRPADSAWDAIYSMWSPRASFAYQLDDEGKTVIRGGAGIFYMPHNMFAGPIEIISNGPDAPVELTADSNLVNELGLVYGDPNEVALAGAQSSGVISGSSVQPDWKAPFSQQYTLGVQRQLGNTTVMEVSFVGNGARRLIYSPDWNRVNPATGNVLSRDLNLVGNFAQNFRYYQGADSTGYSSLQTSVKKRFSEGLQFNWNYTYAWNYAHFRGDMTCCGASENPQNQFRMDLNRGPTSYHIRHRTTLDFIYELPFGQNLTGVSKILAHGWQVGGIFEARTGAPIQVRQGVGNSPGGRPDIIVGSHESAVRRSEHDTSLPDGSYQFFNNDAFAEIPINEFGTMVRPGNIGRRSIYGPGLWNLDASMSKNIMVREQQRLQFRVDMYNFFNHTNFVGVQGNIRSGTFGRITSTAPGRRLQLNLRYDF